MKPPLTAIKFKNPMLYILIYYQEFQYLIGKRTVIISHIKAIIIYFFQLLYDKMIASPRRFSCW